MAKNGVYVPKMLKLSAIGNDSVKSENDKLQCKRRKKQRKWLMCRKAVQK